MAFNNKSLKKLLFSVFAASVILVVLMAVMLSTAFAAGDKPPFEAIVTIDGSTATVSVKTSEAMEYSSLEVQFNGALPIGLTCKGITDGADVKNAFKPSEEANINAATGLYAIINENETVSVAAGKELAVYTFDISDSAAGENEISFVFTAAADLNGEAYGWEDKSITATVKRDNTPASSKYTIEEPNHGKAIVDPKEATVGETVKITATPDEGYEVDSVVVLGGGSKPVSVTKNEEGSFSFKMPDNGAKIIVTFKEANCPSKQFKDLDTDLWYHEGVDYAIANGLMNGMTGDQFNPYGNLNRAMLVTILYRLEGEPDASGDNPFSDVLADSWYDKAVKWADSNGIVMGYGNGKFGPTDNITREQMAAMMMRYTEHKKIDISKRDQLKAFSDAETVSSWAIENVKWAVAEGLIKGSSGKLMPLNSTTRAEAATILMRFVENSN